MIKLRTMKKSRPGSNWGYLYLFLLSATTSISNTTDTTTKNTNSDWLDILLSDPKEAENFIGQNHFGYKPNASLIDLFTFGGYRVFKNLMIRLVTNYTPIIVSNEKLDQYAKLQKRRLLLWMKELDDEVNKARNTRSEKSITNSIDRLKKEHLYKDKYDIIRDLAVDFSVYGGSNNNIKENFYILEKYLNNFLSQRLMNAILKNRYKERSFSYRFRYYVFLYGLNFKFNSYWSKLLLNMTMPDVGFLSTPSNAKNLLYKFSTGSLENLVALYEGAISMINDLDAEKDEEKLEAKLQKELTEMEEKIQQIEKLVSRPGTSNMEKQKAAVDIQISNIDKQIILTKLKEKKEIAQKSGEKRDLLEKVFTQGPSIALYKTPGMSVIADAFSKMTAVLGYPIRNDEEYKFTTYELFRDEYFKDVTNEETTEVQLIEKLINDPDMKRIYKRRNQIFFERAKEDYLQQHDIYVLSVLIPYIKRHLQNKLEEKVSSIMSGIFFDISEIASKKMKSNYIYAFPEDLVIDEEENKKLVMFSLSAVNSIKANKPIPHVIFSITGDNCENHVKSIMQEMLLRNKIVCHKKSIINPVFLTNFYVKLTTNTEGKKKKLDMSKLVQTVFRNNITSFRNLLESYFIGEKYYYLPWFSQVLHQGMNILYNVERYTLNIPNLLGKKVITLLEISGLEFLCRNRSSHSAYSLATLIYIDLVNHLIKDVTIFNYTERIDLIDKAVLSRIPFQVSFKKIEDRESLWIIVRRLVLDLMRVKKVNFDVDFEEWLFNLVGTIYMEDYEIEDVYEMFQKLAKSKSREIRTSDIMNVFKKKVKDK